MFTAMGVEAFAGRAERELRATGEHVRKRSVETRDELTAQVFSKLDITSRSQLDRVLPAHAHASRN
jgi:hypothetical protein